VTLLICIPILYMFKCGARPHEYFMLLLNPIMYWFEDGARPQVFLLLLNSILYRLEGRANKLGLFPG
jgi:hypothetical protein